MKLLVAFVLGLLVGWEPSPDPALLRAAISDFTETNAELRASSEALRRACENRPMTRPAQKAVT